MIKEPRHIDLHLPRGWNQCTAEELEIVATAIIAEQAAATRYRPFDIDRVKIDVLLTINHLEVVPQVGRDTAQVPSASAQVPSASAQVPSASAQVPSASTEGEDPALRVRFAKPSLWQRIRARIGRTSYTFDKNKDYDDFELPVGYLHAMVTQYLSWIDDDRAQPLLRFPYQVHRRGGVCLLKYAEALPRLTPPVPPMLDGYTWAEYRHLQDWMQQYIRIQNRACSAGDGSAVAAYNLTNDLLAARKQFLAVLLRTADQPLIISAAQWQVILFWWSGLMKELAKKFPLVFKTQPVKKGARPQSPWDFYNRVTATLQKDSHLTEEALNTETYSVTLQKLELMAEEAEELKRVRKK